ncbi:helix-turn-helix domain-containing protein [Bacteroidota bacterium]
MNQLVLWSDMVLFMGSNPRAISEHSHPVIQLVMATKGSFLSKNENGEWIKQKGLLVTPNHFHECDAANVPILTIAIDPESTIGEQVLSNQLNGTSVLAYPSELLGQLNADELAACLNEEDWASARQMIEQIFKCSSPVDPIKKDDRIQRIMAFIEANIDSEITTQSLMDVAHLSESRLLHLFKKHVGLPIRNYLLWYRLQVALKHVISGQSLTTAAYEAGFSDQAHMTRTCVKMLGIPPSTITKNSKFIQVSFPK